MSALDGFYSTWNKAKDTFGVGTPTDGSQHDGSSQLMNMKGTIESAQPDDRWQGAGSLAYAAANKEHAAVYQKLASLDRRLANEVTNAADVVTNGRQNLDRTREWISALAASMPSNNASKGILLAVTSKGLEQVSNTIQQSTDEMNSIGRRVSGLKGEWDALGNQKFAPGERKKDASDEGREDTEELSGDLGTEEDTHQSAQRDVHDALSGDQQAAGRVAGVFTSMSDEQKAGSEDLDPTQGAYLSQLNAQMHGMSAQELLAAEQQLGDHKEILSNAWQMMSNDDVKFPSTEKVPGALDDPSKMVHGGFDQLPQSVQDELTTPRTTFYDLSEKNGNALDYIHANNLHAIATIVGDGDPSFQANTDLDRAILAKSADMTERLYLPGADSPLSGHAWVDPAVSHLLESVSNDHQAIHDAITTGDGHIQGIEPEKFLKNLTHHAWNDDGESLASLFSWTGDETHPSTLAAETAQAYGHYVGDKYDELLNLGEHRDSTLGEVNPKLVQGMAHGLAPYIPNIAEMSTAQHNGFDFVDTAEDRQNGRFPIAKGIFSVMSSDGEASNIFNGGVADLVAENQQKWAEAFKSGNVDMSNYTHHLEDAATLKGLSDVGIHNAIEQSNLNDQEKVHAEWAMKKEAWDTVFGAGGKTLGLVPGPGGIAGSAFELSGMVLEGGFVGPEPRIEWKAQELPNMDIGNANAQALNALHSRGVDIQGLGDGFYDNGRLNSYEEMESGNLTSRDYKDAVNSHLRDIVGDRIADSIDNDVATRYNNVTEDIDP